MERLRTFRSSAKTKPDPDYYRKKAEAATRKIAALEAAKERHLLGQAESGYPAPPDASLDDKKKAARWKGTLRDFEAEISKHKAKLDWAQIQITVATNIVNQQRGKNA
jgi:hypothetical protein